MNLTKNDLNIKVFNKKIINKPTVFKTFFVPSIVFMMIFLVGVTPAYAQVIKSTDVFGTPQGFFRDYYDVGVCTQPDTIYFIATGFPPNANMYLYTIDTITSGNSVGLFGPGAALVPVQLVDEYVTPFLVQTDANGNIPTAVLVTMPHLGYFNLVMDVDMDNLFTSGIDSIDAQFASGFIVTQCPVAPPPPPLITVIGTVVTRGITSGDPTKIQGSNLDGSDPSKTRGVHVISSNTAQNMASTIEDLKENSVFSAEVHITDDGVFEETITWKNPTPGIYNIILDMDDDDTYDPNIDIIDYTDEIGFIVVDSSDSHNDILHLGDNGIEREVYNSDIAENIYTLAKNLPTDVDVDIYTISEKLLKNNHSGWTTWESSDDITLSGSAVTVYDNTKVHTEHTSSDGTLFLSTWKNPSDIFDQDFIDKYGKKFNIVIDVDQDGLFDSTIDKVDTYDIGDMTSWFVNHNILDSSANDNNAVSEYKEYLNSKLDLGADEQLDSTNDYDDAIQQASYNYLCSNNITTDLFNVIKVGAQTGFRILLEDEYYNAKETVTGRHVYDNVDFDSLDVGDGVVSVIVGSDGSQGEINDLNAAENSRLLLCNFDQITINDMTTDNDSTTSIIAKSLSLEGDVRVSSESTLCMQATSIAVSAGTVLVVDAAVNPEPVSKLVVGFLAAIVTAGASVTSYVAC